MTVNNRTYRRLLGAVAAGPTKVTDLPDLLQDALPLACNSGHLRYDFQTQTYTLKPRVAALLADGSTVHALPSVFHGSFLF